jgi:hypothetical protein
MAKKPKENTNVVWRNDMQNITVLPGYDLQDYAYDKLIAGLDVLSVVEIHTLISRLSEDPRFNQYERELRLFAGKCFSLRLTTETHRVQFMLFDNSPVTYNVQCESKLGTSYICTHNDTVTHESGAEVANMLYDFLAERYQSTGRSERDLSLSSEADTTSTP